MKNYLNKFEELKKEYSIDENCVIVVNETKEHVVYDIRDEEDNSMFIEFYPILNEYTVVFNDEYIGEGIII